MKERALARQLNADQDLLAEVIDYALHNLTLGYDFQHAEGAAVELARAMEQAISKWSRSTTSSDSSFGVAWQLLPRPR